MKTKAPTVSRRAKATKAKVSKATRAAIRSQADQFAVDLGGCYFDPVAADHVIEFFRTYLRHSMGEEFAGKPFEPLPWQRDDVLRPLFGWKRADGTRRYRQAYIEIPKKNGKSTLCAGIALYGLAADNEPGAQVYSAAADRGQAAIVFREAAAMVYNSPTLSGALRVNRTEKRITWWEQNAWYQVISADAHRQQGINAHYLIFDELHAQKNRELWDALRYAFASRRQPLLVAITTAGYDRDTICWEQHKYAKSVITADHGFRDDAFFGYIRAADETDDWTAEATWFAANPSLGDTIKLQSFRDDFNEAAADPKKQNSFRRYRLNQWTKQDTRWLDMDEWAKGNADPIPRPDLAKDEQVTMLCHPGRPLPSSRRRLCYAGYDRSSRRDLTSLALLFPDTLDPQKAYVRVYSWVPEDTIPNRVKGDRVPYDLWLEQEYLRAIPGNVISDAWPKAVILEVAAACDLRQVAYDPWNAEELAIQLYNEEGILAVEFRQGFRSMNPACKRLEEMLGAGQLIHGDNPIVTWAAENLAMDKDPAECLKPNKEKSGDRIDPMVATIMAVGAWHRDATGPGVSETQGVIIL